MFLTREEEKMADGEYGETMHLEISTVLRNL